MNSKTTFDVYSAIVCHSLYIFCMIVMIMIFSTVLCGLDTTEGTRSEQLVYRALDLEIWQRAGAPENEMHKEEVSE